MRVLLLSFCIALSACASPNWVNPRNPAADLQADTNACEKDGERVGRIHQLTSRAADSSCLTGPACTGSTENKRIQVAAEAQAAQKKCMAARGWRQG